MTCAAFLGTPKTLAQQCLLLRFADSEELFTKLDRLADRLHKRKLPHNLDDLRDLFYNGAAHAVRSKNVSSRS